jgi:3',5'-cyclic AMP phosphodiesterase CpdA
VRAAPAHDVVVPVAHDAVVPHRPAAQTVEDPVATAARCGHPVPGVLPARAVVTEHRAASGGASGVRALHLTFMGDASRSITVQWNTPVSVLFTALRYRADGDATEHIARGYSFVHAGSDERRQHRVHLCGLEAGRRYRYEVPGAPAASFVTAPDEPSQVRILVAGDSRSNPHTWRVIAERAMRERPDVMVFTGDAVDDGSRQMFWDAFFDASPTLLANVPAYWIDGNHEGINAVYDGNFAFTTNGDAEHHGRWWASTYGPMRLIGLNDVSLPPKRVVQRGEAQFLERELAAVNRARTPWVVTAHHAPMHTTSGGSLIDLGTRRVWGPLYDRYHVNLDLAGHTHNYLSSRAMLHDLTLADDTHGTRYFVFGGAGADLYQFRTTAPWVQHQEVTHGFAILTLDARRGRWQAWRADGSPIETIELVP